ncbi:hypothetical protein GKR75_07985 [Providencia sp. wls1919]|nr:hypothetical protein [Providencia sp. wls1919]
MKMNTHEKYNTVEHEHVGQNLKEVCVVKCANGRFFVENNWEDKDFENIVGISNPHIEPFVEPSFFPSFALAYAFAIEIIRTIYPDFNDEENDE